MSILPYTFVYLFAIQNVKMFDLELMSSCRTDAT